MMKDLIKVEERKQAAEEAIIQAAETWRGDFFSRKDLVAFSGNAFTVGHLANMDSKGQGPGDTFYNGRRRVYGKAAVVKWMLARIKVVS